MEEQGRSVQKQQVELLLNLPVPTDKHSLQQGLGMLGFNTEFIDMSAAKPWSLSWYLKKGPEWQWSP